MEVGAILLLLRLKTWVMTLPTPQYKVGPLFCFCSIVIVQNTYYEMDFNTTIKWILKQTFFFTKLSGTIIKVGPRTSSQTLPLGKWYLVCFDRPPNLTFN